jgi:hypothetical protein
MTLLFVFFIPMETNEFAGRWNKAEKRRKFFEDYARAHGFDPLNPENWYSEPSANIMATKVLLP